VIIGVIMTNWPTELIVDIWEIEDPTTQYTPLCENMYRMSLYVISECGS